MLCTLVVVQFSMTDLSCHSSDPSSARLDYYTTPQVLCQGIFKTFSKVFSSPRPPSRGEPYYFTILFPFCQGDYAYFFRFLPFLEVLVELPMEK